ncbi:hypothetical protein IGI04_030299 [Brassica rapa subsp. trilocularis]|uniref:Uncharacterized protein n=1 Tax=Brassica rapa subsp. trilocularis TaxID=1813537 RepID=A0ABQ7LQB1_BRACM|nr:hypothetical protein IGI04_030299 [Brassica rapa subsp. trilocularis]
MKQCSLGIDGLRSSLSASKSEHEDSIFRDYTLDLSFLSSDDSLSRDVDTTTKALLNPNPLVSKLPEMLIVSSTVAGDGELELSCANAAEHSSTDSEEDTPCWIGINSRETPASAGAICRRSTDDDLSGFRRLNPLAPQFIPSNSIKVLEKDGLKKSLSSDFPSSSAEFKLDDAASILADESLGFVSQDGNEFQQSKRLDPSAPVFVPSNAKLTPSAFETNAHSTTYSDNKLLGKVKIDTPSREAAPIHISGSYNKSRGQRRLNPLAPQFSLPDTKPKAYSYGSSSFKSPTADTNFGSTKWYAVEPNTTLSVNGNQDFPFHVVETAAGSSSRNAKASSGGSSPKMDVMKLLTTIHGLSELLTLAHGSESSDSPEELHLINSTVHNLNMYIQNGIQEQSVVQHNSYDLQLLSNKSKLSIRDLQFPSTNNMTVDLGVRRKEKYSVVSGETFPDSGLYQYGVTKDEGFGQVVAKSGYQQNHQGEEQINPQSLFYKSLWLKAEAERCLMVYETSLSNPGS